MPYDITKYEPAYGGLIKSDGTVVNQGDTIDSNGNVKVAGNFSITPSGTQTINNDVVAVTMQNAATATGNGSTLNTTNQSMAVLDVQGTFVGTITVEATIDGTSYFVVNTTSMSTETRVATITATGQYSFRIAGYINVRARISAYTSGSITVYGRAVANGITHHTVAITNTPAVTATGSAVTNADAVATNTNSLGTAAYNYGYNGTTWDRLQVDANKNLKIAVASTSLITPSSDGVGSGASTSNFGAYQMAFNGSTFDRFRGNITGTILTSSARTTAQTGSDMRSYNARGIIVYLNVTVASGTGGLSISIQSKDNVGLAYKTAHTAVTAVTATGLYTYVIYPGTDTTNTGHTQVSNAPLPYNLRVNVGVGDASSYTYSVSYDLIV